METTRSKSWLIFLRRNLFLRAFSSICLLHGFWRYTLERSTLIDFAIRTFLVL